MQGSPYLTKGYVGGDFLIADDALPTITRESATISNATGAAVVYLAGTPLIVTNAGATNATAVAALSGQENSVNGLLLEKTTVLANSTLTPVGYVTRGPTAINVTMLPSYATTPVPGTPTDLTGAAYVLATLKSRLVTLGIIVRQEGVTQQEQTT